MYTLYEGLNHSNNEKSNAFYCTHPTLQAQLIVNLAIASWLKTITSRFRGPHFNILLDTELNKCFGRTFLKVRLHYNLLIKICSSSLFIQLNRGVSQMGHSSVEYGKLARRVTHRIKTS